MELYEAIETRKSVRSYLDKPVEEEKFSRIMEAARIAPSARNDQEWRIVAVTGVETRKKLAEACNNQMFVAQAPFVLVICAETDKRLMSCGQPAYAVDAAIITDHITLAAAAEGLGTCWIGAFDPEKVKTILGIPEKIEVVAVLPLGYPSDPEKKEKSRKPMEEILSREKWDF
ncbi:MAG: nitroreductase family protein [Spirochaetia bacterium]